ncbi:hypothetical protein C8J57DRAFT_1440543 [Mycena rebaudengoi]|nr:hypothetical protein C8J57DRAFT_1440543 [Mycena rebaudengoi]
MGASINIQPVFATESAAAHAMDELQASYSAHMDFPEPEDGDENSGGVKITAPRYFNSDIPLRVWLKYRANYLEEEMHKEGCGSCRLWENCSGCGTVEEVAYRCCDQECHGWYLYCDSCMVQVHQALPLHWIEKWDGDHFKRMSLRSLGLVVQLGHAARAARCVRWEHGNTNFTVIHTNGIHRVVVDFCNCGELAGVEHWRQMMRVKWWPATPVDPQTCATDACLRQFQTLNCLSKISGYDYYQGLVLLTDNTGLDPPADRRKPFMQMVRQWCNIKLLKHGGRRHAESDIEGTKPGELALICPACPQPGINLPTDWKTEAEATCYKYFLHLGQDANFRLQQRMVSSEARDPTLGQGLAYFVDRDSYMEYIKKYVHQEEISTCSGFQAMFLANLKRVCGQHTSGVGGVTCTRHNMWRGCGFGDLQKGEQFCNMDFILFSSLRDFEILYLMLTYDIACQYYKKFWDRMRTLPEYLHLNIPEANVFFKIPNFHIGGHKSACYAPYSLHFTFGAGQTKEMGPGSWQDTLDDILGANNYPDRILQKRMVEAIKEAVRQREAFLAFDVGLETAQPEITAQWAEVEAAWQADNSRPCPYETKKVGKTMKDVELEIAKEEYEATDSVQLALDVRRRKTLLTYMELDFLKRRSSLLKRIHRFRELQDVYMPGLRDCLTVDQLLVFDQHSRKEPESVKLYLPSALSNAGHGRACAPGIADVESRLRCAEVTDALEKMRDGLRLRTVTNRFKVRNVQGQRTNTRAQGIQHSVDEKIHAGKAAYMRLEGDGPWMQELRVLEDAGVASSGIVVMGGAVMGEARRALAWIWMRRLWKVRVCHGAAVADAYTVNVALHAEWCKARARSLRWKEELVLLDEEMRRTIEYGKWWPAWWEERREQALDEVVGEGRRAYAAEGMVMELARSSALEAKWNGIRSKAQQVIMGLDAGEPIEVELMREDMIDGEEEGEGDDDCDGDDDG